MNSELEAVYLNNRAKLHRINGPARIQNDGYWHWYKDGKSHRYYGPTHGIRWFLHGKLVK